MSFVNAITAQLSSPLTVIAILVITGWLTLAYLRKKKRKLPPGPTGLPLLGVALSIGNRPEKTFTTWSKQYGDILGFKVGSGYTVVLNSYEDIEEALVKNALTFNHRPDNPIFTNDLQKSGILASDYAKDYIIRRKFFHRVLSKLGFGKRMMEDRIVDEAERLVNMLGKSNKNVNLDQDAKEMIMFTVGNVVSQVAFGKRFPSMKHPHFECIRQALEAFFHTGAMAFSAASISPWLLYLPKIRQSAMALSAGLKQYRKTIRQIVKEHRDSFDPNDPRDFIDEYFLEQQKNKELYTDNTLECVLIDLFAGGTETTAVTVIFSILLLANRPHIIKKVHEEIDSVLGPNGKPNYSKREKLPYCHAVVKEVMRIRSVAPLMVPHAVHDNVIFKGFDIPKGTTILCNIHAVHSNPKNWKNPEEFDPSRFIRDGKVESGKFFIPFGIGPRLCIGRALAEMEVFILVVTLLQHFDITPIQNSGSERPWVMDDVCFTGLTVNPPFDTSIRLVPRHLDGSDSN